MVTIGAVATTSIHHVLLNLLGHLTREAVGSTPHQVVAIQIILQLEFLHLVEVHRLLLMDGLHAVQTISMFQDRFKTSALEEVSGCGTYLRIELVAIHSINEILMAHLVHTATIVEHMTTYIVIISELIVQVIVETVL